MLLPGDLYTLLTLLLFTAQQGQRLQICQLYMTSIPQCTKEEKRSLVWFTEEEQNCLLHFARLSAQKCTNLIVLLCICSTFVLFKWLPNTLMLTVSFGAGKKEKHVHPNKSRRDMRSLLSSLFSSSIMQGHCSSWTTQATTASKLSTSLLSPRRATQSLADPNTPLFPQQSTRWSHLCSTQHREPISCSHQADQPAP